MALTFSVMVMTFGWSGCVCVCVYVAAGGCEMVRSCLTAKSRRMKAGVSFLFTQQRQVVERTPLCFASLSTRKSSSPLKPAKMCFYSLPLILKKSILKGMRGHEVEGFTLLPHKLHHYMNVIMLVECLQMKTSLYSVSSGTTASFLPQSKDV